MDGTPVRIFDTWLHYLPDMRLVPTDKTEEEILAWETAGTRDDEIRKILSVLKPMLAEADSIPVIMGETSMYIRIWTGRKRRVICIITAGRSYVGRFLLRWKKPALRIVSAK